MRLGQDLYLSCIILLPLTNHRLIVQPLKTPDKYKYKAFISYRHSENGRRHAVALETALKRYAKPRFSPPMKIFRDEKHMKPDINLPRQINDGLAHSEYLIFLADPSAASSQWCQQELETWCNPQKLGRVENLIIVLIGGTIATRNTEGIDFEKTDALPELLQPYLTDIPLYVDLTWAEQPEHLDIQNNRYKSQIIGLLARLRHITPEELSDEEIRVFRKNIRIRNQALGIVLTLFLAAAGASFWALEEKGNAEGLLKASRIIGTNTLPQNMDDLVYLDSLNCDGWHLEELPGEIGKLTNLRGLILSNNHLALLPGEIGELEDLQWMDLHSNALKTIPGEIGLLSDLQYLNLSMNQLETLPPEIGNLDQLETLDLSSNHWLQLPDELGKLQHLKKLDLSLEPKPWPFKNFQLTAFPEWMGKMPDLQWLNLSGNKITTLPSEIGNLTELRSLDLSLNELDSLPMAIGRLRQLESLNVSDNGLQHLAPEIGHLTSLHSLSLSGNQLNGLPTTISHLTQLRTLNLAGNTLDVIPLISTLQSLDFSYNRLSNLTADIGNFSHLHTLDLSNNMLKKLPPEIGNLKSLITLNLWGNPLKDLPKEIGKLESLEVLVLDGSNLQSLPAEITHLKNLKKLHLDNTGIKKSDIKLLEKAMPWCKIFHK